MRRARLLPLLVALVLSGCLGGWGADDAVPAGVAGAPALPRPPVVALIDTGIQPYHAAFQSQAPLTDAEVASWGAVATAFPLSSEGSLEDRLHRDRDAWAKVERGTLYRFEGTRLLSVTMGHNGRYQPLQDSHGHGTAMASLVTRDAPGAVVVLVQVDTRMCIDPSCLVDRSVADAMEWVAEQPWIDIVSVSLAIPGNVPDDRRLHPEAQRYLEASRRAHEGGKIVVNGAGNQPTPGVASYFNGPPWIICAGGGLGERGGESIFFSRLVDVAANHTDLVADHATLDGWLKETGTSVATPIVAATLAQAMILAAEAGHEKLTPDALRGALNASAVRFGPTDWRPGPPPEPTYVSIFGQHAPVVAPGPQMGWGYVHAGLAPEIAARARGELPPRPDDAVARWQAAWQGARETYWRDAARL